MTLRDDVIKGAIEQFMQSNPEPWRGHPEMCKWYPRPNLVTVYRRAGFLWLRKVMGGNCTGCDWRVEGWQWTALTNWNNLASRDLLGG